MDGLADVAFVRVRLGSGHSCEVRQEFTLPGEWRCERIGKLQWSAPRQGDAVKVWLCTGAGVFE